MGTGPFASQRIKQLKALFTSSRSPSAAAEQMNKTSSDDALHGTKSSFGNKLARILNRRRDSGYGSSGHDGSGRRSRKTKTTAIPMPLDPKAAEAAAREFVRHQSSCYPPPVAVPTHEDPQEPSVDGSETVPAASQSEYVGSDGSSSEYTQIVVYPPRLVSEAISPADVGVAHSESPSGSSQAAESPAESRPASMVSSASSSEYTQTVLYYGPLSGSALEAAVMQYTADWIEKTQQASQMAGHSVASELSPRCSPESPKPDTRSSIDAAELNVVESHPHNDGTPYPVQEVDSYTLCRSTHSHRHLDSTPLKRGERHVKQHRLALFPEENTIWRRRHRFFKQMTTRAAEGRGSAMANALKIARYLECHLHPNTFIPLPVEECSCPRHEMSRNDWLWLRRAQMINLIHEEVRRRRLASECGEIIIIQMVPDNEDEILAREDFEVHLDYYVKEGVWCSKALAQQILTLQVRPEELRLGPCAVLPEPIKAIYPPFQKLSVRLQPTTTFSLSRLTQLEHLCEAVAYERKEWRGLSYENGAEELQLYCDAFHATQCGEMPPHLSSYYREWTYLEQRLLRAGELVFHLLQEVNEGKLQLGFFQVIRGTLLNISGQPYFDLQEFEKYFYSAGLESGIEISRFPHILILHPEYDSHCQHDEERLFNGLLENSLRFQEEEAQRLQGIETAKEAYAKFWR